MLRPALSFGNEAELDYQDVAATGATQCRLWWGENKFARYTRIESGGPADLLRGSGMSATGHATGRVGYAIIGPF